MTTSPGVNIAGTVSLLPDPGTTPPLLKLKNPLPLFQYGIDGLSIIRYSFH